MRSLSAYSILLAWSTLGCKWPVIFPQPEVLSPRAFAVTCRHDFWHQGRKMGFSPSRKVKYNMLYRSSLVFRVVLWYGILSGLFGTLPDSCPALLRLVFPPPGNHGTMISKKTHGLVIRKFGSQDAQPIYGRCVGTSWLPNFQFYKAVCFFDWSSCHNRLKEEARSLIMMNSGYGGVKEGCRLCRSGFCYRTRGHVQTQGRIGTASYLDFRTVRSAFTSLVPNILSAQGRQVERNAS